MNYADWERAKLGPYECLKRQKELRSMKRREWLSLWRFDREIDVPHASVVVMCPWAFVRFLWYSTSKEFKAWPCTWDTGIVIGWRWPWWEKFKEKAWLRKDEMPLAIYGGPMDEIYLARAVHDLGWDTENALESTVRMFDVKQISATVHQANHLTTMPKCHNYWTASCPNCARRALTLAIQLKAKYEPARQIDPHESPLAAFRRREAEAKKQLGVGQ
jgi:hypothetical protein